MVPGDVVFVTLIKYLVNSIARLSDLKEHIYIQVYITLQTPPIYLISNF